VTELCGVQSQEMLAGTGIHGHDRQYVKIVCSRDASRAGWRTRDGADSLKAVPSQAQTENARLQLNVCCVFSVHKGNRIGPRRRTRMFFRNTFAFSTFVMSTVAIFWSSAPALSDESRRQNEGDAGYLPIQSINYEFGSKAMSGYFVPQGSVCLVTS
jgi:hypothetical protein